MSTNVNASIKDLCGVSWVGTDYNISFGGSLMVVKWIYYPNGTCEAYFDIHNRDQIGDFPLMS